MMPAADAARFETPEDVDLQYRVAGPGSRFAAFLLDQLILGLALFLFLIALVGLGMTFASRSEWALGFIAMFYLIAGFLQFAYFTVAELCLAGRTPGKRALGLAVVMAEGYALTPQACLIRNFFRVIDSLPPLWLVPLFADRHRRLGDLAAGTLVVRAERARIPALPLAGQRHAELPDRALDLGREELRRFNANDLQVLEEFFAREDALPPAAHARIAQDLADAFLKRLERPAPPNAPPRALLKEIYLALRDYL